ncbi:MAG: deoxyribodipyrimidine photo-lyase, partial [Sodalis sp. (in: enterobacteria)]
MQDYHRGRDIPALDATSRLSAWLAIGVLSPRQCYQRLSQASPQALTPGQSCAFTWLNERKRPVEDVLNYWWVCC